MTNREKFLARLAQILESAPSGSVQTIRFAVVEGQPVWWSLAEPARLEGFKQADTNAAMVEHLGADGNVSSSKSDV